MARVARTILFALVAGVFASTTALHAQTPENSWTAYASDPGGYRLGWGSAHWISGLRGMLVWGGHSHNYRGNNSVRLFDPRTNAWQFLWPDGWSNGGLQNRDNHASFYVPGRGSQGEFWVIGGNYTTAIGDPVASGNHFAGRFDLVTRTWFVAHSPQEFAAGLIAPPFAPTSNPAHAWCDQLNSGVLFGGSAEGNAVNVTALIEPNPGGPTPYRYWAGVLPGSPPPRAQVRAQGVCVGRTFYVYGGFAQETRTGQLVNVYRNDLWRLDVPTRTWTQVASGGQGGEGLVMTHDSLNNLLVVHGGRNRRDVHVYDIALNTWRDMTWSMRRLGEIPWKRQNHVGVYAPTVNTHLYTGGNTWNEDGSDASYVPSAVSMTGYAAAGPGTPVPPPPPDTVPPAVSIGSPVGGSTVSASVTLSASASDNVGVLGVQWFLDGARLGAENPVSPYSLTWDTRTAANGPHTLLVEAWDAAGNRSRSAPAVVRVFNSGGPPPGPVPPPTPPPPPSGQLSIPLRTWVAQPLPLIDQGPMPRDNGGKHSRLLFDSTRGQMVLTGGDYATSFGPQDGNSEVWAINLAQGNTWTMLRPWCAPAGELQPGGPDNVVWVYDSKRDQGIIMPGFYFYYQGGPRCSAHGTIESGSSLLFDFATNKWQTAPYGPPPFFPDGYGGDGGSTFGVYDPPSDAVYRFRWDGGWGNNLEILYRASNTWERIQLGSSPYDDAIRNTLAHRDQPAIDIQGRNVYVISRRLNSLLRYSISDKKISVESPLPSRWVPPIDYGFETHMAFDSINRVLLIPDHVDYDGLITGLAIYHVDTKQWEWEVPPSGTPAVRGNVFAFDEKNNAFMLIGGHSSPQVFWLYRYGNSTGDPPPGDLHPGFFAYHPSFVGGVFVAVGDVDGDGHADIITGAGPGGGPHVRVFSGRDGHELLSFFAYDPAFRGGVWVAAADVDGDGHADIITGAGPGGGSHVRVWKVAGVGAVELRGFMAYATGFAGGVRVAAADVDGDGHADIITGAGPGGGPHVRVFSGRDGHELLSFFAYGAGFTGGVSVAAGDLNGDGKADIVTGAGAGGGPHVRFLISP